MFNQFIYAMLDRRASMNLMFWKNKKVAEATVREKDIAECETCGCLVRKSKAYRGNSEIQHRIVRCFKHGYVHNDIEEYIYHPYYCKVHGAEVINKAKVEEP